MRRDATRTGKSSRDEMKKIKRKRRENKRRV